MKFIAHLFGSALLVAATVSPSAAQDEARVAASKGEFTLFSPTPRELMREMSTDRPDTTESPYSVDAGHVQLEMSFFDFTEEGAEIQRAIAPMNLKIGLLNDTDLQLVFQPYLTIDEGADEAEGFGDMELRLKHNLWGNDGGDSAAAVMPYIKLPTADSDIGNGNVEGGLIVPIGFTLSDSLSTTVMPEIDIVRDDDDEEYGAEFLHTAAIGRELLESLGGYMEYIGVVPFDTGSGYRAVMGGGFTYALSDDLVLDGGVNIGLNDSADDLNFFTGISARH